MFEGIKIFSTLECFRDLIPEGSANIWKSKLKGVSLKK